MSRAVETMKKNNKRSTFILQLTAMVDMFTIIIVFLLKSFSTSSVTVTPQQGLVLPTSVSFTNPVEGVKLVVSMEGIYIDNDQVVFFDKGNVPVSETEATDPDFIKSLFKALDSKAEQAKEIASVNEEYKFDGKIVMQADKGLSYGVLKKVMYTASMAGFADLKMATMSPD